MSLLLSLGFFFSLEAGQLQGLQSLRSAAQHPCMSVPCPLHSLAHLPIQKSNNNRQNDVTNTELCTQIIQIQALGSMMVGKQFNHSVSQFPPSENNGDNINSNSYLLRVLWASLVVQMVKASACNEGDLDSTPGSGRSPGEGNDNPHQYSCLEKSMDGRAWWATVHRVEKSQTWLSNFTFTFKVIIRIKWYTKKKKEYSIQRI